METKISEEAKAAMSAAYKARREAARHYLDFICQVLDEVGEIEFDYENDDENISLTYDGGNHPEYASNLCSSLYSIRKQTYVRDGKFMNDKTNAGKSFTSYIVVLEDGEMDVENLFFDDIIALAEAIESHLAYEHNEDEE